MPTAVVGPGQARAKRTIGAMLIDAGRLKLDDAERVMRLQREENLRFGDAALRLGVLTQADIDFALSQQFDFPYLLAGQSAVSEKVIAAYAPLAPQVEALRSLRSQLMLRWLDAEPEYKALAILSSARAEGRSFIAANLAVVFAQLGERTLLIDADLRHPCQHQLFGLDNAVGLSAILSGRAGPEAVQRIPNLPSLSVLPAGAQPPNPQELLARQAFPELLKQLAAQLDVILLDTPAASESADAQTVAVRAGAALIVARKNSARTWRVQGVSDSVAQGRATIVGAVLNSY
ncbi:MAG: chain length determinant protein tyrosine kinase EpsG [Candidatus Parcubacteria bacterium]|nr:chain length determinant protein tyrosine kinase EpsG [Burkholderiales bacterium]